LHNGQYIWDRVTGSRFVFWNSVASKWCITGSQWRAGFVGTGGNKGAFICSVRSNSKTPWYKANWGQFSAAGLASSSSAPSTGGPDEGTPSVAGLFEDEENDI
jgi:hypothetical protein